jgi:CheY-like chemotaxis protein
MSAARPRVLIVDDDVSVAKTLSDMLEAAGAGEIRTVHCAADAVSAAAEFLPAIVFLDIELPDKSGYEVAQLLHKHAQLQETRLIALTDSNEHPAREHARASGFERYLVKPVTAAELQKVLRRRIGVGAVLRSVTHKDGRQTGRGWIP